MGGARERTEVAASPGQEVQELWFDDGNIVLRAGGSLYRVYRGILTSRSSVFQAMLSLAPPPNSELVEGCPLIELADPEVEVTPFLRAIFEPEFFLLSPAPTEIGTVLGCLRLAHKYKVDYLRRRVLVHLSTAFPTTLSGLDRMVRYQPPDDPSELEGWTWGPDLITRIRAIQVAREVDAPWMLPRAFYSLSLYLDRLGMTIFTGAIYKGMDTRLSVQDQTSFLKGYNLQCQSTVGNALAFLSRPLDIQGCKHADLCSRTRLEAISLINHDFARGYLPDPLYIWQWADWDKLLSKLCPVCKTVLKGAHQNARQAFWNRLPEIYDVAAWDVLEQLKAAAFNPSAPG
ncbi:hypothetical protein B0H14DRAFT_2382146 [Mycena olivaceomarginata]|nr:hypothetical protein B0H14DRAFT_2382146 [Mycena olivaceomarginata]